MATVQENIERLKTAKTNLAVAITAKGVDVPSGSTIDAYANYVSQIEQGGGGGNRLNDFFKGDVTAITASDMAGVTTIPDNMLYHKTSIKSVSIPSGVTSIGSNAFTQSGIESMTVPDSVTSIGTYAFYNCKSLTSIDLGEGVTSLGNNCFQDCSSLTGDFTIPEGFIANANNIAGIWKYCSGITSFTFMGNLVNVGYSSSTSSWFYGCSSVQYFDFSHCTSVPNLVGTGTFTALTHNYEIRVPQILYDEWKAATNWSAAGVVEHIVAVENPYETVTVHYTTSDGQVVQPSGLTYISNTYDSENDGQLTVYALTQIPANCFKDKTTLTSIDLPSSVTIIGDSAFSGCSGLTSVGDLSSVTSIGSYAFSGCSGLTSIDLSSVTSIDAYVFQNCSGLTSVGDLSNVTTIGISAFYSCSSLTEVDLSSVTSIGNTAFAICSGLISVTINNINVPTGSTTMFSSTTCIIYVPASVVDAYKAASGWSRFASRIQAIPEV